MRELSYYAFTQSRIINTRRQVMLFLCRTAYLLGLFGPDTQPLEAYKEKK
jgi:hypothetical protein